MERAAETLRRAREEKERAREKFKGERRVRRTRRARAPESAEKLKTHRLRLNQESSAAARHANKRYRSTLEGLIITSEGTQAFLAMEAATARARRDALALEVLALQDALASARALPEASDDFASDWDDACDTERLLSATAHIPKCRMTPAMFAESLLGFPTCPAL